MASLEFKKLEDGESPYTELTFSNGAMLKLSMELTGPWRDLFGAQVAELSDAQLEARILFEVVCAVKDYLEAKPSD